LGNREKKDQTSRNGKMGSTEIRRIAHFGHGTIKNLGEGEKVGVTMPVSGKRKEVRRVLQRGWADNEPSQ